MNEPPHKIPWHLLLGRILYLALEPVGVSVFTEVPLLSEAPKADILLLRREGEQWNEAQRRWLADGLRHTNAKHLLVEFKHSQGLTLKSLQQLNAYDYFYRTDSTHKLNDVACFLIIASTPKSNWQSHLKFNATKWPGVYKGTEVLSQRVRILLLNELANTDYNAPIKYFATWHKEQNKALAFLISSGFICLSEQISQIIMMLRRIYMSGVTMSNQLTPEMAMEMGRELIDVIIKSTPLDKILAHHQSDEVLSHYKPDEVLSHYNEDQILSYLKKLNQSKY